MGDGMDGSGARVEENDGSVGLASAAGRGGEGGPRHGKGSGVCG